MSDSVQQIPKGYKQTEVGVIPEDWNITTYGEAFDFLQTATYSREQLSDDDEIKYIHYGDIHTKWNNFLDFSKSVLPFVTKKLAKNYPLLKDGDVIVVDASEDYEGVGKSVEILNLGNKKAISGLHTFLLRDKGTFIDGFRGYIHKNRLVISQFNSLATGMKVYGVSRTNLKTVFIPVPKKGEQISIARILTGTSELIEKLEKLISKKKAIKQGVMQELLTGKKRLPGYSGEWEEKYLEDIFTISAGRDLVKEDFSSTKDELYRIPIYSNSLENKGLYGYTKYARHDKDSVTITARGTIGIANARDHQFDAIGRLLVLSPKVKLNCYFLSEYLNNRVKFSIESTGVPQLTAPQTSQYQVLFPIKEEQDAIAIYLMDMDKEILLFEQLRNKYKDLKQGMMQQLLTGKIRIYESN